MTDSSWIPDTSHAASKLSELKAAFEQLGTVPVAVTRGLELVQLAEKAVDATPPRILDLKNNQVTNVITEYSLRAHNATKYGKFWGVEMQGLEAGEMSFTSQLVAEVIAECCATLDGIVSGWRDDFDGAAAAMMHASQTYGFTWTTTSDYVIDLEDESAASAWRATRPAWRKLNTYHVSIAQLLHLLNLEPAKDDRFRTQPANLSMFFAAGDNWSNAGEYCLNNRPDSGIDWFALAAEGLRLNTPAEAREKIRARFGIEDDDMAEVVTP